MATSTIENGNSGNSESTNQLKDKVEQSVALLCETEGNQSGASGRSSLPIHIDTAYLQKGAIVDAAKALAALWKVPSRAKLPNRVMQYSR
jgi:hypothetical protein